VQNLVISDENSILESVMFQEEEGGLQENSKISVVLEGILKAYEKQESRSKPYRNTLLYATIYLNSKPDDIYRVDELLAELSKCHIYILFIVLGEAYYKFLHIKNRFDSLQTNKLKKCFIEFVFPGMKNDQISKKYLK
jgi:hypothetical protein